MAKKIPVFLLLFSLIAIPCTGVRAIPSGIGVIGDSASEPYQCIGRGDKTSFTWTEELVKLRKVNFGPGVCQGYNHAGSGESIALHMTSQTTAVLKDVRAGKIGRVIIMLGHNDLYSTTSPPDVPALLAIYRNNLNRLLHAGIAPRRILVIDISQDNWQEPIRTLVDQFNAGLHDLANEKGTAFSSFAAFFADRDCRSADGGNSFNVGGQIIKNTWGNEWHNFRLADGHLGTVGNGIVANTLVADFLGITRMSDAELLSIVNGEVIPSNPPPICRVTTILKSTAARDGWLLESGEKTDKGVKRNNAATTIILGDNAQKKQYRSILSFNTKVLPDSAVITKITLKVKKQSITGGGNPVNIFKGFRVDIRNGFFGPAAGLQASDFQAGADKSYGPYRPRLVKGWYSINLTSAKTYINKLSSKGGMTQIRLRFNLDDNNNAVANYLKLYSGNAPAASRPRLIIEYYIP